MAPKGWENIKEVFARTNALLRSNPDLTFEQMIRNDAPDPYIEVKRQREEKARRKSKGRGGYGGYQGDAGSWRNDYAQNSTSGQNSAPTKTTSKAAHKHEPLARSASEVEKKKTKKRAGPPDGPEPKKQKKVRSS
jgi:hypothetical protein